MSPASLHRKLTVLSSGFESLCERSCIVGNPVNGVKQRMRNYNQGVIAGLGELKPERCSTSHSTNTLIGAGGRQILAALRLITASAAKSSRETLCALSGRTS